MPPPNASRGTSRTPPLLALQRLAFPLTLGQLAFAANGFVTGLLLARSSAAAFHASLPASMLAVAFSVVAIATLGYSGTMIAMRHAAGELAAARRIFAQSLLLTALSIPVFLLAVPAGRCVLAAFNTIPEVQAAESEYFTVLLANGFFTALATVLGGPFTGQGKTKLVGAVTAGGFVLNIALSCLLINGCGPVPAGGVAGAGWAATLAHAAACLALLSALAKRKLLPSVREFLPAPHTIGKLLRLGLPNGIKSFIDVGGFFVFTALLAECPSAAVAASTAAFAVNGVFQAFPQGVAAALEIAAARQWNRPLSAAIALVCIYAAVFALLLAAGGMAALHWFLPAAENFDFALFNATAKTLLTILAAKSLAESLTIVLQAYLRGLGRTLSPFCIQFAASCGFWLPLCFAVRHWRPGVPAYWLTMLACSALSAALLGVRISFARKTGSANT